MISFFYVASTAFHTSVPALLKHMDISNKNSFGWQRSHLCTTCCTSWSKWQDLPPITSLSSPKTWKSLGASLVSMVGGGRHMKDRSWIVATAEQALWGWALSCWSKTPVLRRPRCLDLIAGHRRFFRKSAYAALVTVIHLGLLCSKITPRSSQKRVSINFPADGCVRIFFFPVLVRRYGAISCALSWFPAGGSGPRFHLP